MSFLALRTLHRPLQVLSFPLVTTQAASSITDTTATGNGTVVNVGGVAITERGFVWSTNPQPTLADSSVVASGTTTGAYTASLTSLSELTLYHYRAYATNAIGTSYGDDVAFTTSAAGGVTVKQLAALGVG